MSSLSVQRELTPVATPKSKPISWGASLDQLHRAAETNNPQAIYDAIKCGVSPMQPQGGLTPLARAAKGNHKEAMTALLKAGALPSHTGLTPMVTALQEGHIAAAERLLEAGSPMEEIVDFIAQESRTESQLMAAAEAYVFIPGPTPDEQVWRVVDALRTKSIPALHRVLGRCSKRFITNDILPHLMESSEIRDVALLGWLHERKKIDFSRCFELSRQTQAKAFAMLLLAAHDAKAWPGHSIYKLAEHESLCDAGADFLWFNAQRIAAMEKDFENPSRWRGELAAFRTNFLTRMRHEVTSEASPAPVSNTLKRPNLRFWTTKRANVADTPTSERVLGKQKDLVLALKEAARRELISPATEVLLNQARAVASVIDHPGAPALTL